MPIHQIRKPYALGIFEGHDGAHRAAWCSRRVAGT